MLACARKSFDGGKLRSSWSKSAISTGGLFSAMVGILLLLLRLTRSSKYRRAKQATEGSERRGDEQLEQKSERHPDRHRRGGIADVFEPRAHVRRDVRGVPQHEVRRALLERRDHDVHGRGREEPDDRAEDAGAETEPRARHQTEWARVILLGEIRGDGAAPDDPEAAAVGEVDNRQCRQHSDEEAAEQYRLGQS